jgi:hypothetical protein
LTFSSWSISSFSPAVTQDTIVYPIFTTNINDLGLTITNGEASVVGPYSFNQVVTVTANGTGTFNYWLKDGLIASLDETYTFTLAGSHELEAVYDTSFVANTGSFVGISDVYDNLRTGYYTVIGNIDLVTGEELVEWGIITSDLPGGITLDTPGVVKYNSNKLNSGTNEFVMSFAKDTAVPNYRAFVTTINGTTVKTYYSYYQENNLASDLIISEYGEGSSNNKWIEIYNGTGNTVNLSGYNLKVYINGSTTPESAINLTGSLSPNDVYVVANGSSNAAILALADMTSGSLSHNGNDAIGLFNETTLLDIVGPVGSSANLALDTTLTRKSSVNNPTTAWDTNEWNSYGVDVTTYLGNHTMDSLSILVTDNDTPTTISILGESSVNVGENIQLSSTVTSESLDKIIWISSDTNIASISENGLVTGISTGTTTIYAYSYFNHSVSDSFMITVNEPVQYTVSFNSLGGNEIQSQTVLGGEPIVEPINPFKDNNFFDGWYTSNDDGLTLDSLYNFDEPISSDFTLYAKWIDLSLAKTVTEIWDASYSSVYTTFTDVTAIGVVAARTDKGYILQDNVTAEMISIHDTVNIVNIGDKVYLTGQYNVSYNIARILNISLFRKIDVNQTINYDTTNAVDINFTSYNQADYIGDLVKIESPWVTSYNSN